MQLCRASWAYVRACVSVLNKIYSFTLPSRREKEGERKRGRVELKSASTNNLGQSAIQLDAPASSVFTINHCSSSFIVREAVGRANPRTFVPSSCNRDLFFPAAIVRTARNDGEENVVSRDSLSLRRRDGQFANDAAHTRTRYHTYFPPDVGKQFSSSGFSLEIPHAVMMRVSAFSLGHVRDLTAPHGRPRVPVVIKSRGQ